MQAKKLTPNLLVRNVEESLRFYEGTLGFRREILVPDKPPFVFASVRSGDVEIFFNDQQNAVKDLPELGKKAISSGSSMFIEVDEIEKLFEKAEAAHVPLLFPLKEQWYGMKEFGIADPDGHLIIFAEKMKLSS